MSGCRTTEKAKIIINLNLPLIYSDFSLQNAFKKHPGYFITYTYRKIYSVSKSCLFCFGNTFAYNNLGGFNFVHIQQYLITLNNQQVGCQKKLVKYYCILHIFVLFVFILFYCILHIITT